MHIENYISYTHTHIFAKDQTQSTLSFSPSHILPSPNQRPPDVEGRALIRDPAVNICESCNRQQFLSYRTKLREKHKSSEVAQPRLIFLRIILKSYF